MVFDRVSRGLRMAAPALTLAAGCALGVAPALAQAQAPPGKVSAPNDTLDSMLGALGLRTDKESIDYRARPPIVVPPRLDLPKPKEVVHNADWPKDPDIDERRHSAAAAQRPAPQGTSTARAEPSSRDLPKEGPPSDCQAAGLRICIDNPWKMFQNMAGIGKPETVEPGVEPPRTYLTEPPSGYRMPAESTHAATAEAPKAEASVTEAPKEQPIQLATPEYVRAQQAKSAIDGN